MVTTYTDVPIATALESSDRDIAIRVATDADNDSLLALTRVTPMEGKIALRIDRDPDFFALLRRRGDVIVLVATFRHQVIGCISAAIHEVYINGLLETIAHIGDLKVHPLFTGKRLSSRLMTDLKSHLKDAGVDLCVGLIAEGNHRMTPISKGRDGTHVGIPLGRFIVEQLIARPMFQRHSRYEISEATYADFPPIAAMLDDAYRERLFAPRVTVENLLGETESGMCEAPLSCRMVARDADRILATLLLEDTYQLRQNVLIGAPKMLKWAIAAARPLGGLLPSLTIPRLNYPIKTLYVRNMACTKDGLKALRALIDQARSRAFRSGYTFVSIGLHDRDPLRSALKGIARLKFHSLVVAASILSEGRLADLSSQIPYEDFALV